MAAKTKALRLCSLFLFLSSTASLLLLSLVYVLSHSAQHQQHHFGVQLRADNRLRLSLFLLLSTACSLYLLLAVHLSRSTSRPLLFHSFSLLLHLSSFVLFPSFSLGLLPFRAVACTTMRMLNISKCCACS